MDLGPFVSVSGHVPTAGELLCDLTRIADRLSTPTSDVSATTRAAYESDWRQWEAWCDLHDLPALPVDPEMVRLYVADLATQVRIGGRRRYRAATVERHLSALAWHSRRTGGLHDFARHPRVAPLLAAVREQAAAPSRVTRSFAAQEVGRVIEVMDHATWPGGVAAARDTLLVLVGHSAALGRSAAASLSVERALVLPFREAEEPWSCARCALRRWLALVTAPDRAAAMSLIFNTGPVAAWEHHCTQGSEDSYAPSGPLLRAVSRAGAIAATPMSESAVDRAFKRRLAGAGFNPGRYGYGSLRAGSVASRP